MRRLLRAAAYRASGGGRVAPGASPDEDAFTLAATAVERAVAEMDRGTSPLDLDLLADLPSGIEWAFPAVVGAPVRLLRSATTARGLVDALRRAEEGTAGEALVVAAELPVAGEPPRPGEPAAVAFLFGGTGGAGPLGFLDQVMDETSPTRAAMALYRSIRPRRGDPVWVGDWEPGERPATGGTGPPGPAGPEPRSDVVSQGAYVPRPRYLENLPSRWRFVADRCGSCGQLTFPAGGKCRFCGRTEGLVSVPLPRDGALVVATTVIGPGGQPTEFDPQVAALGPYEVVLAEIAPGVRVTLQLTDAVPGTVRIGDRVDTRLRRLFLMEGEWRYGRKAVPQVGRPAPEAERADSTVGGSHGTPTQPS
jgi:uncharacterized OB-fold protein